MSERKYKIIRGPTIDRLELLVNEFLKTPEAADFYELGGPQVFGHEEYIQTYISYGDKSA